MTQQRATITDTPGWREQPVRAARPAAASGGCRGGDAHQTLDLSVAARSTASLGAHASPVRTASLAFVRSIRSIRACVFAA
jgi:hypothetical protein